MEMCYDGALVMPSNYAVMSEDEMMYVDGGITIEAVCSIIGAAIALGGASYAAGQAVGERLYYKGINTSKKWAKYKWQARVAAIAAGGNVYGPIFIIGLENKLYSKMK